MMRKLKLRVPNRILKTLPPRNPPMVQVDKQTWVEVLPGQTRQQAIEHFNEMRNRPTD